MSRYERTGKRDLTFSHWHRMALPDATTAIDVDLLEYCRECHAPLCLIEATREGDHPKPTIVTRELARAAGIPALLVRYTPGPRCRCVKDYRAPGCVHGIAGFRVRSIWPPGGDLEHWRTWELAAHLETFHDSMHALACRAGVRS